MRAAVEHAFANGIYRVEAHVRVGNVASERVLERAGFQREGVKRRFLRRGGEERADATLFARLAMTDAAAGDAALPLLTSMTGHQIVHRRRACGGTPSRSW